MAKLLSLSSLAAQASTCCEEVGSGSLVVQSECSYYHYLCDGLDDRVCYTGHMTEWVGVYVQQVTVHIRYALFIGMGVWLSKSAVSLFLGPGGEGEEIQSHAHWIT